MFELILLCVLSVTHLSVLRLNLVLSRRARKEKKHAERAEVTL